MVQQKTTIETSIKNITLDVAGTGVGGFVGMKIGTVVLPGVGTAIGGIIGAVLGRLASNQVKYIPLKTAFERYEQTYSEMNSGVDTASRDLAENFRRYVSTSQSEFKQALGVFPSIANDEALRSLAQYIQLTIQNDIKAARIQVNLSAERASNTISDHWYHFILGIAVKPDLEGLIKQYQENALNKLAVLDSQLLVFNNTNDPIIVLRNASRSHIVRGGQLEQLILRVSEEVRTIVEYRKQELHQWTESARFMKQETSEKIREYLQVLLEKHSKQVEAWRIRLGGLETAVRREQAKLGK